MLAHVVMDTLIAVHIARGRECSGTAAMLNAQGAQRGVRGQLDPCRVGLEETRYMRNIPPFRKNDIGP